MDQIIVTGNGPLNGQIPIAGAKNACLTLMPATLLSDEPLTLTNAPRLSDIRTMTTLLQSLGAEVQALCARCGHRSSCLGLFWRGSAMPRCPCPAAVPSGRARSTCI